MSNKRNNELVRDARNIINASSLSLEEQKTLNQLVSAYENATYGEYEERHNWYRRMVSNMVNDMGFESRELAESMAREHPTLQQSFMRMCARFIKMMSAKTTTDGRNEASVRLAKKMCEDIDDVYLPFI